MKSTFFKILLSLFFPPYALFWLYKAKGWKPFAICLAAFVAFVVLLMIIASFAPTREERIASEAVERGVSVEQVQTEYDARDKENARIRAEKEAADKAVAVKREAMKLPAGKKYYADQDKFEHEQAVDNGFKVYFFDRKSNSNTLGHAEETLLINKANDTNCSVTLHQLNSFRKMIDNGFTQWNRLNSVARQSFNNNQEEFPTIKSARQNIEQISPVHHQCVDDFIASHEVAFINIW